MDHLITLDNFEEAAYVAFGLNLDLNGLMHLHNIIIDTNAILPFNKSLKNAYNFYYKSTIRGHATSC